MKERSAERSAACATCGKTFARSDTLLRHEKSHHTTEDRGPVHRVTNGTFRACRACAAARSRCSGGTPCGRCNLRKMDCIYPNKRRKGSSPNDTIKMQDASPKEPLINTFTEIVFATTSNGQSPFQEPQQLPPLKSVTASALPETVQQDSGRHSFSSPTSFQNHFPAASLDMSHRGHNPLEISSVPSVHSQIMQHDQFKDNPMTTAYPDGYAEPASTYDYGQWDEPLNWIPLSIYPSPYDAELEQDFSFLLPSLSETPNLNDFNVATQLETSHSFQPQPATIASSNRPQEIQGYPLSGVGFEQSPSSSGSDGILANKSMNSGTSATDAKRKRRKSSFVADVFAKPRNEKSGFAFPDFSEAFSTLGTSENDHESSHIQYEVIIDAFRKLCANNVLSGQFVSNSFPDIISFNACIELYFDHFHATFPLIHKATFGQQTHWTVVLAVAAIGSTFARAPGAVDLREAFQEFLRRAVNHSADGTADYSLDVALAQARVLNLIGLAQSDRDGLRALAPRYHADLSRWCLESGVLQLPESGDVELATTNGNLGPSSWQLWDQWIRVESLRRIAYLIWLLDCSLGYIANARPLCNMDDARTPLPCSERAWNCLTLEHWLAENKTEPCPPSLCAAVETLYSRKAVDPQLSELAQILLIHALYQRTWEVGTHIKQPLSEWVPTGKARGFLNTPSKDNFWLPLYPLYANWRNSACDCLDVLHWQASSIVAKASGVEHGLILHLHLARIILLTPFQEIQDLLYSLVGNVGNASKASFYVHDGSYQPRNKAKLNQIRKITWRWLKEDQHKARLAMIHAGSVFWHVRRYSSGSLYEPAAIYLASIVLWTYGSYKSAALERDAAAANAKPVGGPSGPDADESIVQPSRVERRVHGRQSSTTGPRASFDAVVTNATPTESRHPLDHITPPEPASVNETSPAQPDLVTANITDHQQPASHHSDSDTDSEETDAQPEFIHLDRPCDDEMVQHFVRNGHNMSGHMSNVGDICKTPQKVLLEGAKLLRTRLACWGVSREYYDVLTRLAELRKAT